MFHNILIPDRPNFKFGLHVWLDLQSLLQVVKGSVLETWVADEIVELVPSFYDIHVEYVLRSYNVFFFEDANISIDV